MIAIVDDDASVREALKALVRSLGYGVSTFGSAQAFLNCEKINDISCVITDVQMPGMSGIELLARLKADGHRFPVMVITAFPDDGVRDRAMQHGASGFLTKPFSQVSLIDCLDRALKAG